MLNAYHSQSTSRSYLGRSNARCERSDFAASSAQSKLCHDKKMDLRASVYVVVCAVVRSGCARYTVPRNVVAQVCEESATRDVTNVRVYNCLQEYATQLHIWIKHWMLSALDHDKLIINVHDAMLCIGSTQCHAQVQNLQVQPPV